MQYESKIHIRVKNKGDLRRLIKIDLEKYWLKGVSFNTDDLDFVIDSDWGCPYKELKGLVLTVGDILKPLGGIVIAENYCYSVDNWHKLMYNFAAWFNEINLNRKVADINELEKYIPKKISNTLLDEKEIKNLSSLNINIERK